MEQNNNNKNKNIKKKSYNIVNDIYNISIHQIIMKIIIM